MRARDLVSLALLSLFFGACRCTDNPPATVAAADAASAAVAAPEPTTPAIKGWFCTEEPPAAPAPAGAFTRGPWWVAPGAAWQELDDSERMLNVRGMRDTATSKADGAYVANHLLPSGRAAVLIAKERELPEGLTFDAAHAQKIFDEFGADTQAVLLGARLRQWGGRPAVEGAVAGGGAAGRTIVHHLILPTEGRKALAVSFISDEGPFHKFLGEACAAVGLTK